MNHAALVLASTASRLRTEAMQRLAEIPDHGCEAASARAFEEGRLSILDALGFPLLPGWPVGDSDEVIEQRRRDLDEALRPEATRQQMAFEPIVRPGRPELLTNHRPGCSLRDPNGHLTCTCDYWERVRLPSDLMTEPESTEATTETEDAAVEEPADEASDDD